MPTESIRFRKLTLGGRKGEKSDERTFLGYVSHPGIRPDGYLLEGAIICEGVHEDLVHQMVQHSRKEAHLQFLLSKNLCCGPEPQSVVSRPSGYLSLY